MRPGITPGNASRRVSAGALPVPADSAGRADKEPSALLRSRGAIVFAGLSYLFAGFAFSYVERSYRSFSFACALWLVWAALGFGAGVFNQRGPDGAGRRQWQVLGLLGFVLAVFPGILLFSFPRWVCMVLLVVMGARAAQLRTRRDLYLTMTVVFAVCFLTTTHYAADWSLWFYLGPAWLCGALTLAWLHAEGVDLSRWTKLSMTAGFVAVSFAIAATLFLFAPRPPVLGFGFLPGGDTPGLFDPPFGKQSDPDADQRARGQGGQGGAGGKGSGWGSLRARGSRGYSPARPHRSGIACWTPCGTLAETRSLRSGSAVPSMGCWTRSRRCATGGKAVAGLVARQELAARKTCPCSRLPRAAAGQAVCSVYCYGWFSWSWHGCCGAAAIDGACAWHWLWRGACRAGLLHSPCGCQPVP